MGPREQGTGYRARARPRRRPTETLTPQLKQAIEQAGDSPVRLSDPETHRHYVLVSADVYDRLLEQEERREQQAFLRAAKKNAKSSADGGCMIRPGEIYLADFDEMEAHPVVVVFREELNRGNWVTAVLITSKRFEEAETAELRPVPSRVRIRARCRLCGSDGVSFLHPAGRVGRMSRDARRDAMARVVQSGREHDGIGLRAELIPVGSDAKSGWPDSNRRSPAPKAGGLPGFPTSRRVRFPEHPVRESNPPLRLERAVS